MIPVTLSTGSIYTYGLDRVVSLAARAGYDGLEIMVDDRWDTRQPGYLREMVERHGVPVLSVHSPFVPRVAGWPSAEIGRIERTVTLAENVGARAVNVHLPQAMRDLTVWWGGRRHRVPVPGASAAQRDYRAWLAGGGLATLQARTPVEIVVENLPMRRLLGRRYSPAALNTPEALVGFPKLCLDTTHAGTAGWNLLEVQRRLGDRIRHVHLSDYRNGRQHLVPGKGDLPLGPLLERFAGASFDGIIVVELDPATVPVGDDDRLLTTLRDVLNFCRTHLGQANTSPATG